VGAELSGLSAQGIDLAGANPAVIGQALELGTATREGSTKLLFANIADILKEQERKRTEFEQFQKNISGEFLKKVINEYPTVYASLQKEDIDSIMLGEPNQNVLAMLTEAEAKGLKAETQVIDAGGRKLLINSKTGDVIRDYGVAPGSGGIESLTPFQQLEARNISTSIFGKLAGAKAENINLVAGLMADGMTSNDIRDALRESGQSSEFVGAFRDAAENIAVNGEMSDAKRDNFFNTLDRHLSEGNYDKALETIKVAALASFPAEEAKQIRGKDRTVEFLLEIKDDLKDFKDAGGNTGIFNGNDEKIRGMVGAVDNPQLRTLATKISTAIISYRRAMSGVAFSVPESKEYKSLFPNIDKTFRYNEAVMEGLLEGFIGELDYSFGASMGEGTYKEIYGDVGARASAGGQGEAVDVAKGIVGGYDIKSYATDPRHEQKVSKILGSMGQMESVDQMNRYIRKVAPDSPVTGDMVAAASRRYGVSWEMIMAMMQQDSTFGTKGKAVRTLNPGNVGNDDAGNERNYGTWQEGVDAVAEWLSRHEVEDTDIDYSSSADLSDLDWGLNPGN
jgi:predicted 3-demethylubiquinone-9 3-methyltransferase (glyoxalase superfamily)